MPLAWTPCKVGAIQGAEEVDHGVEDRVDVGGNTGGLEKLAEAWRFLGALESGDNKSVRYFGTLERVIPHHSSLLNTIPTSMSHLFPLVYIGVRLFLSLNVVV